MIGAELNVQKIYAQSISNVKLALLLNTHMLASTLFHRLLV